MCSKAIDDTTMVRLWFRQKQRINFLTMKTAMNNELEQKRSVNADHTPVELIVTLTVVVLYGMTAAYYLNLLHHIDLKIY